MVLLDIDCDFMLGADCNNGKLGWADCSVAIGGKTLGKRVADFIGPKTKIHLVVDHHEALYYWDKYKIKKATCYHVDAHHDCFTGFPYGNIQRFDRRNTHCGNFISQAILDEIIEKAIFVPAFFVHSSYWNQSLGNLLGESTDFDVMRWRDFIYQDFKADVVTISISPEWFPPSSVGHIIDLCEVLNVSWVDTIDKANKKWKFAGSKRDKRVEGDSIVDYDFVFPYVVAV